MNSRIEYDSILEIFHYKQRDRFRFYLALFYFVANFIDLALRVIGINNTICIFFENFVIAVLVFFAYILVFINRERKACIWPVYFIAFLAIASSVVFHPEYVGWFQHNEYGLNIFFGQFKRAIYCLLVVGLFTDRKKLSTVIVWSSRINLVYYMLLFYRAMRIGYWESYSGTGKLVRLNYGLTFGYNVAFIACVFLLLFIYNKNKFDLAAFVISISMIVLAGSRGALLCIVVEVVLIAFNKWRSIRQNGSRFIIVCMMAIAAFLVVETILPLLIKSLIKILSDLNVSSRSLEMLLSGTFTSDNGRNQIYDIAKNMIAEGGIFGYGFYGDRYEIGKTWHYGYPHNIFYELLIQFGIILGGVLIALLAYSIIKMFLKCKDTTWQFLFVVMFSSNAKLMISDSFWYYTPFWGLLGVLLLWNFEQKRKKRKMSEGHFKWKQTLIQTKLG